MEEQKSSTLSSQSGHEMRVRGLKRIEFADHLSNKEQVMIWINVLQDGLIKASVKLQ